MRAVLVATLILVCAGHPAGAWADQKSVTSEIEAKALKEMAGAIPLGSRISVQTSAGARMSGTLMSVTDDAVIIKKRTRVPEPAVAVRFSDLARLELQPAPGMNAGKVIGIGLAAGAGAILTLFAFVAAFAD